MSFATYFKLIRYKNLLLIFYVFFILKFVFLPSFQFNTTLSIIQFLMLLFSVLFIAAAGNIINDIFDVKADVINKPNRVIVSKKLTFEQAKHWYKITNTIGVSLGILLSINIGKPSYSFIFITTALLLYFYSKKLKSIPLLGNVSIALLVAISIVILPFFELFQSTLNNNQIVAVQIIISVSLFAFILNLIREIIKDIEDIDGDYQLNINTLPILFGRNRTRDFVSVLCIIPLGFLLFIITFYSSIYKFTMLYLLFFTFIPLLYILLKLRTTKKKHAFHKLSHYLKIIMFFGINSFLIFTIFN